MTIEVFGTFNEGNNPNSTLFTFGPPGIEISLAANYLGDTYIAVVYNPHAGYRKLYVNGIITEQTPFNSTHLIGDSYEEQSDFWDFIGRSTNNTTPGMEASLDSVRIWYGELSKSVIYNHFLAGADPSHITLTSAQTVGNINITFASVAQQYFKIGVYGGTNSYPMFGSETKVQFIPVDQSCLYRPTFPVSALTSAVEQTLSAMNYTVVLEATNQPLYFGTTNDPEQPTVPGKCSISDTPQTYFKNAGSTNQTITITYVNQSTYNVIYTYHSGICMEAQFCNNCPIYPATSPGGSFLRNVTTVSGVELVHESCVSASQLILPKGDNITIKFTLFELYPEYLSVPTNPYSSPPWFQASCPIGSTGCSNVVSSYTILNSGQLIVQDEISGKSAPQTFTYNSSLVLTGLDLVPRPVGFVYKMNATTINPILPYDLLFSVYAQRNGPDGIASVTETWYIPVTGLLPSQVPNYYPVAIAPSLIFLVLRDPPGGSSFTRINQGTTISWSMAIDGKYSSEAGQDTVNDKSTGEAELEIDCEGIGEAVCNPLEGEKVTYATTTHGTTKITTAKSSDTHYDFSFTFDYSFSTSTDPNIAGQPSDVIIGGGLDIIVNDMIQGILSSFLVLKPLS